jgi:hypothetical protein
MGFVMSGVGDMQAADNARLEEELVQMMIRGREAWRVILITYAIMNGRDCGYIQDLDHWTCRNTVDTVASNCLSKW